jgi:hypothetical protein
VIVFVVRDRTNAVLVSVGRIKRVIVAGRTAVSVASLSKDKGKRIKDEG